MLHHVFVHFIAGQFTGYAVDIESFADFLVQAEGVVALDAFIGADARHDRLATAAEPGHQVIDDAAGQNDLVGFRHPAVDNDRHTVGSRTELDQIGLILAIMLVNLDPVADLFTADGDVFRISQWAMRAECDNDRNVIVSHAGFIQLGQQRR